MSNSLVFHPLTPDLSKDFQAVMGPSGACYGCWCTLFRMRPKDRQASSATQRRDRMLAVIAAGPPPGLLLYLDGMPTGWMQIGPRSDVPEWNNPHRSSTPLPDAPADDPSVWATTRKSWVTIFLTLAKVSLRAFSN